MAQRGRPTDDPKRRQFNLRVSDKDLAALDMLAEAWQTDRSGVIRELIHRAVAATKGFLRK